jgi:hypothetical protein
MFYSSARQYMSVTRRIDKFRQIIPLAHLPPFAGFWLPRMSAQDTSGLIAELLTQFSCLLCMHQLMVWFKRQKRESLDTTKNCNWRRLTGETRPSRDEMFAQVCSNYWITYDN